MSERKPTPDVLADLLGAGSAPVQSEQVTVESQPAVPRRPRAARPSPTPRSPERSRRWEYLVVSFQNYRGWRPRYEGGVELSDWTQGPLLVDYLRRQGEEGWELVSACSGESMFGMADRCQLYFRRVAA